MASLSQAAPGTAIRVTPADLASSGDPLKVTVAYSPAGVFTLSGVSDAFSDSLPSPLTLEDHRLILNGAFPVRVEVSIAQASAPALHLELAGVTINEPTAEPALKLTSNSKVNLDLTGGSSLKSDGGAGIDVGSAAQVTVTSSVAGSLEAVGGPAKAGIGGAGNVTIGGDAVVTASGGSNLTSRSGGAGIGGHSGPGSKAGTITIGDSATVTAKGGVSAAGIGGGSESPGAVITIGGSATVNAEGGGQGAGIGGGSNAASGAISIGGQATVFAGPSRDSAAIGAGRNGAMGEITISGNAKVRAHTQVANVAIGGSAGLGEPGFVKITGSPLVLAAGNLVAIGGYRETPSAQVPGSVIIEGGYVIAQGGSDSGRYSIGGVSGGVKITGGSVYPGRYSFGTSGVQDPVNASGKPVFPLYVPAYDGGVDLTDLDLSQTVGYPQRTVTGSQRDWIAANGEVPFSASEVYPLPSSVPAAQADSAALAATVWLPESELAGLTMGGEDGVYGFGAAVTDTKTTPVGLYQSSLMKNVLRLRVLNLEVTADGAAGAQTSSQLMLTFDQPVEDLDVDEITVTDGTGAVITDPDGWSSNEDFTVWTLPLASVTEEGTVTVGIGGLPAGFEGYSVLGSPATSEVFLKAPAPVLTAGVGTRTSQGAGTATFTSDRPGSYCYRVTAADGSPPTAAALFDSCVRGSMTVGSNTISFDLDDSPLSPGRLVYVAGIDSNDSLSNVVGVTVPAFPGLTVVANPLQGGADSDQLTYLEGAEAFLTATAQPGYEFDHWQVDEPTVGKPTVADPAAAETSLIMPSADVTVTAVFKKKDLTVRFDLNAPPSDTAFAGWPVTHTGRLGEVLPAVGQSPPTVVGYMFVGWFTEPLGPGVADSDEAWDFASGVITAGMIDSEDQQTVNMYGAWQEATTTVSFDLHGPSECTVAPASITVATVPRWSKLTDAAGYETVPVCDGFTFAGWFLDAEYATVVGETSVAGAAQVVVHAKWLDRGSAAYQVEHYLMDSDRSASLDTRHALAARIGTSVTAVPRVYPGYRFDQTSVVDGTVLDDGSLVLELYYEPVDVVVVFDAAGGIGDGSEIGSYGELAPDWPDPVRDGHAFVGWSSQSVSEWDFGQHALVAANGVTGLDDSAGRLELTANWVAAPRISGESNAVLPEGGSHDFELTVTSAVGIDAAEVTDAPAGSSVTAGTDGQVSFNAGSLPDGEYTFSVVFTDTLGQSRTAELTVVVQGAPSGAGRHFLLEDDQTAVLVDVMKDVTGTSLRALDADSLTPAAHGTVTLTDSGAVSYAPRPGYWGDDSFTVRVCDDLDQCETLAYSVTIEDTGSSAPIPVLDDPPAAGEKPAVDQAPGRSGASGGSGARGLPLTGAESAALAGAALALVLGGAWLIVWGPARRRRSSAGGQHLR
jgi:hypothetical protein